MDLDVDIKHMRACLNLALQAQGRTAPNPMVGAVVVDKDGKVIGEGFHQGAGFDHAEIIALAAAGNEVIGGTLYVNLEPCCHYGRTPPCVDRIIASQIKHVVVGMVDPDLRVSGGGIEALKQAGIDLTVGVLEDECSFLNRGFVKVKKVGLPWLCLKLATTLDGKIADRQGKSQWISGPEARVYVHRLRNSYDCVMVGAHTQKMDDPILDVRLIEGGRNPLRAIVDTNLTISPKARVLQRESGGPTVVFCSEQASQRLGSSLPSHIKVEAVDCEPDRPGHLALESVLRVLVRHNVHTVLCEGGGRLAGSLLNKGLVDEVNWIVAPKMLGDNEAYAAIVAGELRLLNQSWCLDRVNIEKLGVDVLIQGVLLK